MTPSQRRSFGWLAVLAILLVLGGCVERTMKIDSDPQGARVLLNDEEVGVTPAKLSFLWYGDYDVILRKDGFETLKTHYRLDPPWYQYPPFDLIAECLIPATIRDAHVLPTYELKPMAVSPIEEIAERANEARRQASGGEP